MSRVAMQYFVEQLFSCLIAHACVVNTALEAPSGDDDEVKDDEMKNLSLRSDDHPGEVMEETIWFEREYSLRSNA